MSFQPSLLPPVLLAALALGCRASEDGAPLDAGPAQAVLQMEEVEASCGECQFGMPGETCDLAVRIDGRAYFVQGTGINDHGDAHADDGFCQAIRKARVSGRIEGELFVASAFELLPAGR